MEKTTGPPSLAPPATTYQDHLSPTGIYTFYRRYAVVLAPCATNPTTSVAAPANVGRLIYATSHESAPNTFLQWNQYTRRRGSHIALLRLVSSYVPGMGLLVSLLDNLSLTSKGETTCGSVACANWQTASIHQIGSTVHILANLSIDTALVLDPDEDLLGPFTTAEYDMEPLCVHKTIYLCAPFIGLFLEWDLSLRRHRGRW